MTGPVPTRRALVVGAFGHGNPGDEALLEATLAAIDALSRWEPVVVTTEPEGTTARTGACAVPPSPAAVARQVLRADALVVAGGTLFKELHPSTRRRPASLLRRALALAIAFRARGKPVALIGVGAAPVNPPSTALVRALASRADLLVLRDEASARLLVHAGVPAPLRVGADLAWSAPVLHDAAAPGSAGPYRPNGERRLGVAVSHLAGGPGLAAELAAALAPLADGGWRIELEPWQTPGRLGPDALVAHEIARRLGRAATVLPPPVDLGDAAERMRHRDAVLALRFHAAVVAAATGTPFVAVAHEPKLDALADRVHQPWASLERLRDELPVALAAASTSGGPDPAAVHRERRRSAATLDLLALVLTGGGEPSGLEHLDLVPEPVPA